MLPLLSLLLLGWLLLALEWNWAGILALLLFCILSWRRAWRRSRQGSTSMPPDQQPGKTRPQHASLWNGPIDAAYWRSSPIPASVFTAHPPNEDRVLRGPYEMGNMGGPLAWTLWLREGVCLEESALTQALSLSEGRWRVSVQCDPRQGDKLLVYDTRRQLLHRLPSAADEDAMQWFTRLATQPSAALLHELESACRNSLSTQAMHRVHGIMVPTTQAAPPPAWRHQLPNGHVLEAQLMLPEDLSRGPDPHSLLSLAPSALYLDGHPTSLHVTHLLNVPTSADGRAFALPGIKLDGPRSTRVFWHLWHDGKWSAVENMARKTPQANGPDYLYDLEVTPMDGGYFHARLQALVFGITGEACDAPVPDEIELVVSWSSWPLALPTREEAVLLRPPFASQAGSAAT